MSDRRDATDRPERTPTPKSDALLANVAILYYKDGLTQSEIAKRLGVSRATVVNYLRLAHEQNIVDIRINGASFSVSNLSRELRSAFGLEDAYVANVYPGEDRSQRRLAEDTRRQVARVGAMVVHDLMQPGDVLGVAWGLTIQWLSEEMPRGSVRNLTICQLVGSMRSPLMPAAETSAIRIAAALGAECWTLHAPAIVSTPELAAALRAEPVIHNQLRKLEEINRSLFSVGDVSETTTLVQTGVVTPSELRWYRDHGAVGVLCGRFIDAAGRHVVGETDDRMIGITPDRLRQIASGILIASGADRIQAIRAALTGGHARYLVIDETTARLLLADHAKR